MKFRPKLWHHLVLVYLYLRLLLSVPFHKLLSGRVVERKYAGESEVNEPLIFSLIGSREVR